MHAQGHSDAEAQGCPQQPSGSDPSSFHNGPGALPAPDASCPAPRAAPAALGSVGDSTFVEFGAGKGYLTALLAECTGARKLVMMDQGAFGLKADRYALLGLFHGAKCAPEDMLSPLSQVLRCRYLRDCDMTRARCDIVDFDPGGVPAIADAAAGWVAMGKHLCGGATDLMLRCGVRSLQASRNGACAADLQRHTTSVVSAFGSHIAVLGRFQSRAYQRGFAMLGVQRSAKSCYVRR